MALTSLCFVVGASDGRFAKNENDLIQCHKRFDSIQYSQLQRYLINSLIFVKPVYDDVYFSISPFCL